MLFITFFNILFTPVYTLRCETETILNSTKCLLKCLNKVLSVLKVLSSTFPALLTFSSYIYEDCNTLSI